MILIRVPIVPVVSHVWLVDIATTDPIVSMCGVVRNAALISTKSDMDEMSKCSTCASEQGTGPGNGSGALSVAQGTRRGERHHHGYCDSP